MMPKYKSFTLFIVLSFLLPLFSSAQKNKFSIEVGPEYRNEDFRWSIAGNMQGQNPNILSELIFKPVKSAGFFANGGFNIRRKFSINGYYNKLWTYDGEVTDFDYDGDNRTLPSTQLYLQSNKGSARSVGGRFNYHFFKTADFDISVGAGYDFTKQLYYLTNDNDPLLNSTYETKWKGPNLSLNGLYMYQFFSIGTGITSRYLMYDAKANWNLIESFQHPVSFVHDAKGYGIDYRLSLGVQPANFIKLNLQGLYSNWKTEYGVDKLYQADGAVIKARMNGAFRKNIGIRFTTTFLF